MIISDNGRQFDSQGFRLFCSSLGIRNKYSSPGHPQANRQTEVTNQTLLKIIKAQLVRAKGAWPEELPIILWAYRTAARTRTRETPFNLTYGIEVVILVELARGQNFLMNTATTTNWNWTGLFGWSQRSSFSKNGQVSMEDGRVLQPGSKAQKVPHQRFHPTEGDTCNEGSSTRQVRANMGRTLQGRLLFSARKLSSGRFGRELVTSSLECWALKEVLRIGTVVQL